MQKFGVDNLMSGMVLGRTIYSSAGNILLGEGVELNERYINRLKDLSIQAVYIKDGVTDDIEIPELISEETRIQTQSTVKNAFEQIESSNRFVLGPLRTVVNSVVDEILSSENLLLNVNDIRFFDEEVFGHSVGVAMLAIMTGIKMGYNQLQLRDLGIGCLLHDIGKVMLRKELLHKKEGLTPNEREDIKHHCLNGFNVLRKSAEISVVSASVALHHHECYDGSGYPLGIKGDQIVEFARIAAVADIYDAITSERTYRKAQNPTNAIQTLLELSGTKLDPNIVKIFITNIALYPVGTIVVLNTGDIGIVIKNHPNFVDRPVIRLIIDSNRQKTEPHDLDLAALPALPDFKILQTINESDSSHLSILNLGARIIANA